MRVEIEQRSREYDGFFKLERVQLVYQRFDGSMSHPVTRLVFERGDSAAVLLYDASAEKVILVEQFRYPAYAREGGDGRLLEIVAGTVAPGSTPEQVAYAELVEEAGWELESLEPIATFYPSPGACTERIFLYLGQLSAATQVGDGGGRQGSGEDIRVHEVPLRAALEMIRSGEIRDAKTIIALQCLAAREENGALAHT